MTESTSGRQRKPRLAPGVRIVGDQRIALGKELAERYAQGEAIRSMADDLGRSYGWVQGMLKEAGVTLRGRGGATRGAAGAARARLARGGSRARRTTDSRPSPTKPARSGNGSTAGVVEMDDAAVEPTQETPVKTVKESRASAVDQKPAASKIKKSKKKDQTGASKTDKPAKDEAKPGKPAKDEAKPAKPKKVDKPAKQASSGKAEKTKPDQKTKPDSKVKQDKKDKSSSGKKDKSKQEKSKQDKPAKPKKDKKSKKKNKDK
ncbi:helix-turn-helix domain-containing protein [Luteococcus sp. Sow4_B9]|uniref:helix-turn-helix domain-containing protein n=1 Tax=Luteococcus sp. Sow4_B9 TaxID=3438792 RepID=UPI003F9E2756